MYDIALANACDSGDPTAFWAQSFNIRAPLPPARALQILGAKNARWKKQDNKNKEFNLEMARCSCLMKWQRSCSFGPKIRLQINNLLTALAMLSVSCSIMVVSIETSCEVRLERAIARVMKHFHLCCSIMYLLLSSFMFLIQCQDEIKTRDDKPKALSALENPFWSRFSRVPKIFRSRGFWCDVLSIGGLAAEILHLSVEPVGVPSIVQWLMLLHCAKGWRVFVATGSLRGATLQIFVLFLWLTFAAHLSACTFALLAILESDKSTKTWGDTVLMKTPRSCSELYVAAIYFSTYTLTSIGYGDIVPANAYEQVVAVVIMLGSQMFAAKVFADLNWITSTSNFWMAQHAARMTQTAAALHSMNVPTALRHRVLACQDFIDDVMKERRVRECFHNLSPPLDEELHLAVYHHLVTQAPFLNRQPVEVIRLIIQSLTDRVYLPGDFIMRKGEFGTELLFLRRGQVAVFVNVDQPQWESTEIALLETGAYFGEAALLTGRPRAAWILARTFAICSVLDKPKLDDIVQDHPSALVILVKSMQKTLSLKPSVSWQEIGTRLAELFEDTQSAFDWFSSEQTLKENPEAEEDETLIYWPKFHSNLRELLVSDLDTKLLFAEMDQDRSGQIGYTEFAQLVDIEGIRWKMQQEEEEHSDEEDDEESPSSKPKDGPPMSPREARMSCRSGGKDILSAGSESMSRRSMSKNSVHGQDRHSVLRNRVSSVLPTAKGSRNPMNQAGQANPRLDDAVQTLTQAIGQIKDVLGRHQKLIEGYEGVIELERMTRLSMPSKPPSLSADTGATASTGGSACAIDLPLVPGRESGTAQLAPRMLPPPPPRPMLPAPPARDRSKMLVPRTQTSSF